MANDITKEDILLEQTEKAFSYENTRRERLEGKAERYIGVIVVIVGFKLFDVENLLFAGDCILIVSSWISVISYILLGFALLLLIMSRRIRDYMSYPRGTTLIDELDDDNINEVVAKIKFAKLYLSAYDTNAKINDNRAELLRMGENLIIIGFVLAVASYILGRMA